MKLSANIHDLSANMTKTVCIMSHLAEVLESSIPEFQQDIFYTRSKNISNSLGTYAQRFDTMFAKDRHMSAKVGHHVRKGSTHVRKGLIQVRKGSITCPQRLDTMLAKVEPPVRESLRKASFFKRRKTLRFGEKQPKTFSFLTMFPIGQEGSRFAQKVCVLFIFDTSLRYRYWRSTEAETRYGTLKKYVYYKSL